VRRPAATILPALLIAGCAAGIPPTATPQPTLEPLPPLDLGAGFRYSTYGIGRNDPGPDYWLGVGREMAEPFEGATPQAVWIVAEIAGPGTVLTFPGTTDDVHIHFRSEDNNEAALDAFDEAGFDVWLQLEPGNASVPELIDIVLDRYGHHSSVIGVGVDVEWLETAQPEGRPVTDEEARTWLAAIRAHDPGDRLFLKHWETDVMPPGERDGILFISDEQDFADLDAMVTAFVEWGETFAPAQVGFQYGYFSDRPWWNELGDPPADIGHELLGAIPNTAGLYWVDFTIFEIFEPPR
jgi:hypothetical protein